MEEFNKKLPIKSKSDRSFKEIITQLIEQTREEIARKHVLNLANELRREKSLKRKERLELSHSYGLVLSDRSRRVTRAPVRYTFEQQDEYQQEPTRVSKRINSSKVYDNQPIQEDGFMKYNSNDYGDIYLI